MWTVQLQASAPHQSVHTTTSSFIHAGSLMSHTRMCTSAFSTIRFDLAVRCSRIFRSVVDNLWLWTNWMVPMHVMQLPTAAMHTSGPIFLHQQCIYPTRPGSRAVQLQLPLCLAAWIISGAPHPHCVSSHATVACCPARSRIHMSCTACIFAEEVVCAAMQAANGGMCMWPSR